MPQINTTLTGHSSKSGQGQRGPWTLHVFTAADGAKYQTFDTGLGNKAFGLLNQPVTITFEVEQRGQYPNNVIKSIDAAAGAVGLGGGPVGPPGQATPAAAPVQAASAPSAPVAPTQTQDDRQLQIMRQSALERAIRYFNATGEPFTTDNVYRLADEFVSYFVEGRPPAEVVPITAGADSVGF